MKNIILILFSLQCVLGRSLQPKLSRDAQRLEKLDIPKKFKESNQYSPSRSQQVAINEDQITMFVYTKAKPNGIETNLSDANIITKVSPFDTELETLIYVHGWGETVEASDNILVRQVLLEAANVNIIIVNWDECAINLDYFISKRCVPDVGKYVGKFIETVAQTYSYPVSNITAVGHSLGAHIAGYIGKYLNGTLGVIVGLDPAGPFYSKDDRDSRLNEDDAQYVQGIHTNALLMGVNFNVGHADFWPNGGYLQAGCGVDPQCSHPKSYIYFVESITNNAFFARQCDSYDHFEQGTCKQEVKSLMGGVKVNTAAVGNFYLDTNSDSPYGMGDVV